MWFTFKEIKEEEGIIDGVCNKIEFISQHLEWSPKMVLAKWNWNKQNARGVVEAIKRTHFTV